MNTQTGLAKEDRRQLERLDEQIAQRASCVKVQPNTAVKDNKELAEVVE